MFLPTSHCLQICLCPWPAGTMGSWHYRLTAALRIIAVSLFHGCSLRELLIFSARPQCMRNQNSHLQSRTEIKMFSVSWVAFNFISPQPRQFQLICKHLLTSYCTWPLLFLYSSGDSHPSADILKIFLQHSLGLLTHSSISLLNFPKEPPTVAVLLNLSQSFLLHHLSSAFPMIHFASPIPHVSSINTSLSK